MSQLIGIAIAVTSMNLLSINSYSFASTSNEITIPVTPQTNPNSWQEKFEEKRQEEEFLDDNTEKLLSRNKNCDKRLAFKF